MMVTRRLQTPFPANPLPYWRPLCFALGILINLLFLRTPSLQAATVVVTSVNDSGPGSLRQAIVNAAAGDTIDFDSTLSGQTIVLSTPLTLTQDLTITGSTLPAPITLSGNRAVRVMAITSGVKATMINLIIAHGRNRQGGGLYNQGTTTLKNVQFYHNQATDGGGIYNLHQLTIDDSTFRRNQARAGNLWSGYGGGIANYHHLLIRNSDFYYNQANIGGAIYDTGTVTITHGDFAYNRAIHGGGISGVQFITDSTFSQNSAVESGGALSTADTTVYNSSFIANEAKVGGAIRYQGVLRLINSTLTRNQATTGGGIYNGGSMFPTGELWLYNSTLLGNEAQNGGGLDITPSTGNIFYLYNTLIAHSLGADCYGTPATIVNSLIEDGSCSATLTGAPRVGPLLYRPGMPPTYILLSDSPAIDAGDPATCQTTDQAGNPRPIDGNGDNVAACDIGAFERQPLTTTPEIYLQGNEQWIGKGDSTPDHADQTDFGQTMRAYEMITHTFVISNVGLVELSGVTVTISGSQANAFRVTAPPATQLTAGNSGAFQLTFSSTALGVRQALVEVYSDTQPSPLYTFAISGRDCRDRLTVTSQADAGPGSLRQALDDLCTDGVITFADTLAGQTILLEEQLTLAKKLTLDGSTLTAALTLSGNHEVRVLTVNPGVAATVKRLIIANGRAPDGYGGGIYNLGSLTVTHSTFMNNFSPGYMTDMRYPPYAMGGGIYNGGQLSVSNSTFTGNATEQNSGLNGGGAIFNTLGTTGTLTVTNSTFSNNGANRGGAIIGPAILYNTIIADSSRGEDCWNNQWITGTNTLIEDGSCGATLSGDPRLGPLADNGGGILTQALLPGSPAIDAGDNATCLTTDQRGVPRPFDGDNNGSTLCDIGAYEAATPLLATATATRTVTPTPTTTPTAPLMPTPTPTLVNTAVPLPTNNPTTTPTSERLPCPSGAAVEPLSSPTNQLSQTIVVNTPDTATVRVTTLSGTFNAVTTDPYQVPITLRPNLSHPLTVTIDYGRLGGSPPTLCQEVRTVDKVGAPLVILQQPVPTPVPTALSQPTQYNFYLPLVQRQ